MKPPVREPGKDVVAPVGRGQHKDCEPKREEPSIPRAGPTPQHTNSTERQWYQSIPWWKILEGAGFVAAVVYTVLTYFMWSDLRHNFEIEQRAWIKTDLLLPDRIVSGMNLSQMPGQLSNVGKSTAIEINVRAVVETPGADHEPSFDISRRYTADHLPLQFPSTTAAFPVLFWAESGERTTLSEEAITDLLDGHSYLTVFGQIEYSDQFGKHWARFCEWRPYARDRATAQFKADACVSWNSIGDGEPPK